MLLVNLAESEKRRRPRRLKVVDFFGFPKEKKINPRTDRLREILGCAV